MRQAAANDRAGGGGQGRKGAKKARGKAKAKAKGKAAGRGGQRALRFVRLGHPARVHASVLAHCLDSVVQQADGAEVTRGLREDIARSGANARSARSGAARRAVRRSPASPGPQRSATPRRAAFRARRSSKRARPQRGGALA